MALVTNEWNNVTFQPPGNAAWTGYTPPYPTFGPVFSEAIYTNVAILVFCIDATGPVTFITAGNETITVDASVVLSDVPITTLATPSMPGETWFSCRTPTSSDWWYYSNATSNVTVNDDATGISDLSAFLA